MRFAVALPNCMHVAAVTQPWESQLSGRDIVRVARVAEELGFFATLVPEHFVVPDEHVALSGDHYFHATTAQAFVAGATESIEVGSLLSILPLHNPIVLAKAIATLDWFSNGRAFVTFGVGWLKDEFDVLRVPFDKRGRMADEYLAAILELWHAERPSFAGEFVSFHNIAFGPKPVRKPHPPVWLGGDADAVLRRAARLADGWAPWLTTLADLPARLDQLRSQPGFDDRPFSVFYSLMAGQIGEGHAIVHSDAPHPAYDRQRVIDECAALAAAGVTDTWVGPPPVADLEAYLDHLRWVAAEIMPAFATTPAALT